MRGRVIAASAAVTLGLVMMGTGANAAPDPSADPAIEQSADVNLTQETAAQDSDAATTAEEKTAPSKPQETEPSVDRSAGSSSPDTTSKTADAGNAKVPAKGPSAAGDTPKATSGSTAGQTAPKGSGSTASTTSEGSTQPSTAEPAKKAAAPAPTAKESTDTSPVASQTAAPAEPTANLTEEGDSKGGAPATVSGTITTDAAALPAPQESVEKAVEKIAPDDGKAGALTAAQVKAITAASCPDDAVCADKSGVASIYEDVQNAIAAAHAEGKSKVVILSGNYAPFTVAFAMQIMAAEGADVKIHTDEGAGDAFAISVQADNVEIIGLTAVCEPTSGYSRGVDLIDVKNVSITGLTTIDCQRGISLNNASGIDISESLFSGHQNGDNSAAIWGDNTQNVKVSGSTFVNQNTGTNFSGYNGLTISDNKFSGMGTASVFANGSNGIFANNMVTGTTGAGVYITGANGFIGSGNTFSNGSGNGFSFDAPAGWGAPSSNVDISGNTFEAMAGWAISFRPGSLLPGTNVVVRGNDFSETGKAILATNNGAKVAATDNNYFGACGANAHDQSFNGGGSTVEGSTDHVEIDRNGCETIAIPKVEVQAPVCRADGSQTSGSYTLPESAGTVYVRTGRDRRWRKRSGSYRRWSKRPAARSLHWVRAAGP